MFIVVVLAVFVMVALAVNTLHVTVGGDVSFESAQSVACPDFAWRVRASGVNLEPGLTEHQSWVEFPVPEQFAGYFAFCLDGQLVSTGGGELDFHTGVARFNVSTRWVNFQWLDRQLDGVGAPDRWELRLRPGD